VYAARCQIHGDDVFRRLVNAQVQLSPGAPLAFARAVLAHVPLARPEHLQAGGVDHDMAGLLRWGRLQPQLEAGLATAHGRVRRYRKVDLLLARTPSAAGVVIATSMVAGILTGYIVDAIHGPRFMRSTRRLPTSSSPICSG